VCAANYIPITLVYGPRHSTLYPRAHRLLCQGFLYQLSMMVRRSPNSPEDAEWYERRLTVKL
jgi:hypothetical protein